MDNQLYGKITPVGKLQCYLTTNTTLSAKLTSSGVLRCKLHESDTLTEENNTDTEGIENLNIS